MDCDVVAGGLGVDSILSSKKRALTPPGSPRWFSGFCTTASFARQKDLKRSQTMRLSAKACFHREDPGGELELRP